MAKVYSDSLWCPDGVGDHYLSRTIDSTTGRVYLECKHCDVDYGTESAANRRHLKKIAEKKTD